MNQIEMNDMTYQLEIFDQASGERLAITGMSLAVETANTEHEGWSDVCWKLFYQWLSRKPRYFEFMVEDFRQYLDQYDLLEKPKSDRAFGFISKRALKYGLIQYCRMAKVKNKKAHATPAHVWMKK